MLAALASSVLLGAFAQRPDEAPPTLIPCTRVITPGAGPVQDIDVSSDGRHVLVGCDDARVFVYELGSGELLKELALDPGAVMDVEFDASGDRFLALQFGRTQVWDAHTFERLRSFSGQKHSMLRASFSPDGSMVATASAGNGAEPSVETEARVWSLASGDSVATVGGMAHRVLAGFRRDSRALLVSSANRTGALVRRLDGGSTAETKLDGHSAGIAWSAWSPDGATVLTVSADLTGRLWDASTGKTKHVLRGHTGYMLECEFSPDGKQASTTSWVDRTTRIWSVRSGDEQLVLAGHAERPTQAHFAPDGRAFASVDASGAGLLFELQHGKPIGRLVGHDGIASALAFTPDSKWIVTGGFDGTVRVWSNPLAE
jgi:WD40 repeat protein